MENPLVSICIPTYNGQNFFEICLDSAIGQTYKNIEIIIVDDGSSDKTYEIAKKYAANDSRIKLHCNEKNLGLVGNWNHCIELTSGAWIKFLFQDDYLALDCIEIMMSAISEMDMIVTSGRRLVLDESLDEATKQYSINETLTFGRLGVITNMPVFITPDQIAKFTVENIYTNFIGEPTVIMFKKEVVKELGAFNPDLIQICDLEYFLRIASNYGIKYIPQPLTYFRVHKGSASTSNYSAREFSMSNMDPIIMVNQLIFDSSFSRFRKTLSVSQKIKLKIFFKVRVYESYKNSLSSTSENKIKHEAMLKKYPEIAKLSHDNTIARLLLKIVKSRRVIRTKV
jgi:glycosyltransferase involved in cell wall biosynthesis